MMYRKLLLIAPLFTLIVVVVGAYTRLTDSGLGCPDWPGCYGQLTAPDTAAEIARAGERFPGAEIDPMKGWIEMIHRYLAGALGLLILSIALIAWRNRLRSVPGQRLPGSDAHWLGTGLLLLLLVQAMLGKFTVTLLLKPGIVTLHLLGGMLILSVLYLPGGLASLRWDTWKLWRDDVKSWWRERRYEWSGEKARDKRLARERRLG